MTDGLKPKHRTTLIETLAANPKVDRIVLFGRFEITSVGGEQVRAFIPNPLPPDPPLEITPERQRLLERATLALGRLDSITQRNRVFAYDRCLAILNEGTEPL